MAREDNHPFIYVLLANRRRDGMRRSVGGITWGPSIDAARGSLAALALKEDFTIEVLELAAFGDNHWNDLLEYAAREGKVLSTSEKTDER